MKIVLFLNKDLEANIAYNLLKEELLHHTIRIYYSESVGNPVRKAAALVKLEYYEKYFIQNELRQFIQDIKIKHSFEFFDDSF